MMTKFIGRFTLLVLLLGTISCKMTYIIPIEQIGDTKNRIPTEDQTVVVVNRGNNYLSNTLDSLTIQSYFLSHKLIGDTIINSDIVTDIATQSMADQLYNQNKEVILDLSTLRKDIKTNDSTQIIKPPLTEAQMLLLYSQHRVPKALVLEGIITQIQSTVYDSEYSMKLMNIEVTGKYVAVWRYYDLEKRKVLFTKKKEASLYWNADGYNLNTLVNRIPPFYQINGNIAYISSEDISKLFEPVWNKTTRNFFFLNKKYEEEQIVPQAKDFKWKKVFKYYQECLNSDEYKTDAYKIYHNLAVCSEMMGNQTRALELINHALSIKNSYPSSFYKRQLILLNVE
ncbi:DUF6340 family protein [Prolixibacteraceae bacterium]|nr:DUF6340 family protein [Prolixibacteraceae bacterium]